MGKNQDPGSGINIPDLQHCGTSVNIEGTGMRFKGRRKILAALGVERDRDKIVAEKVEGQNERAAKKGELQRW
jgi:hypothetical protein